MTFSTRYYGIGLLLACSAYRNLNRKLYKIIVQLLL